MFSEINACSKISEMAPQMSTSVPSSAISLARSSGVLCRKVISSRLISLPFLISTSRRRRDWSNTGETRPCQYGIAILILQLIAMGIPKRGRVLTCCFIIKKLKICLGRSAAKNAECKFLDVISLQFAIVGFTVL